MKSRNANLGWAVFCGICLLLPSVSSLSLYVLNPILAFEIGFFAYRAGRA